MRLMNGRWTSRASVMSARVEWPPSQVQEREAQLDHSGEPTLRDLSEALVTVRGTDCGLHTATWISDPPI